MSPEAHRDSKTQKMYHAWGLNIFEPLRQAVLYGQPTLYHTPLPWPCIINCLISTSLRNCSFIYFAYAVEVKLSASVSPHDIKGLASLRDGLGDHFVRGVVVYTGQDVIPLGDRIFAVPVGMLFAG